MRKLFVGAAVAAAVVVGSASPSFAFFCTNASRNEHAPHAGTVEFKESNAQADMDTSHAWNSTATGAWVDAGEFGGPEGVIIFARAPLHPAAGVGSPDHGIVEAE